MPHQYVRDEYNDPTAPVWGTVLTILAVTLFFLMGWFGNDLYQRYLQQNQRIPEVGVGGGPIGPTAITGPIIITPTPTSDIVSPLPDEPTQTTTIPTTIPSP